MDDSAHNGIAVETAYEPDVWIGGRYQQLAVRVLILGESSYDRGERLESYVPRWLRRDAADYTFSRITNAFSSPNADRLAFWETVAFYNFVTRTLGARKDRPKRSDLNASCHPLEKVLAACKPHGVVILGKGQAVHSRPVVERYTVKCRVLPHPASRGVRTEVLASGWRALQRELAAHV